MRAMKWVVILAVAAIVAPVSRADCGKVVVLSCPPGMNAEDFLKQLQQQQGNASNLGTVTPDTGTTTPSTGDTDSNGTVPIDPIEPGDYNEADGSRRPRGQYFAEPAQRAVIAWNGKEEILVLKTEERSLIGKGAMLSFLPLPGKPIDVRKADQKLFDKAYDLVTEKLKKEGAPVRTPERPTIERVIGAHTIFVWYIDNPNDFANKIQSYIQRRFGHRAVAVFSKDTERVVKEYLKDGYRWFAFDLLAETDKKNSEKVAIEYHFESEFVYYPLRDSQSGGAGNTRVELVVFTPPEGVNVNKGKIKFADKANRNGDIMTLGKRSVSVANKELAQLHGGMAQLFDGHDVRARIWVLRGPLTGFHGDVQAYHKD